MTQVTICIFEDGAFRLVAKYVELRNGIYCYRRRVPEDVRHHYPGNKATDFKSLKTRDPKEAAQRAHKRAKQQDALWQAWRRGEDLTPRETVDAAYGVLASYGLKPGQSEEYGKHDIEPDDFVAELVHQSQADGAIVRDNLPPETKLAADLFYGKQEPKPFFSDVVAEYEGLKSGRSRKKAKADRQRVLKELYAIAGDLPIERYTRAHANALVDALGDHGNKSTTIKRKINQIAPVMAHAIREYDLNIKNPFERLNIPDFGEDVEDRIPFTSEELEKLKAMCLDKDDDIRWIAAMLHDTGARLGEIAGLRAEDVRLSEHVPNIRIRKHEARSVKSKVSERDVPLVGIALWAAGRALDHCNGKYLFPRYTSDDGCKATHASNTLASFCKKVAPKKTAHCYRHAMRDRLRSVECPPDITNAIGGWRTAGVGESYGSGHSLDTKLKWLSKVGEVAP